MPSWSFSSALLALCSPDYENIWAWPTWGTVTGCDMPLFHPDFPASGELPPSTLEAVRKYANKFWDKKKEVERLAYAQASRYTDTLGRSLWSKWATTIAKRATINGRIDKVLEAHYRLPHQLMDETRKANLGAAQTQIAYPEIGLTLFGEDALIDPDTPHLRLKPFVHSFVHMLVVMTWDRFRKSVGREISKLDQMRVEVNDAFTAISVAEATPTPFHIRVFIRKAEAFIELLRRYQDNAAATEVNQWIETMLDMFGAVGSGDKARASKLPNALRQALEHFATANIVQSLADHLNMIISGATLDMDMDMPDIPNEFVPSPAWEEGTEEYSHLSVDQLWVLLGLPDKAIPFFNTKLDPTGLHNPWTEEGNAFFEDDRNSKINLTPRWHQLVGLYEMMNMAFIAEPVVLMDEVGLGKTLQIIALVACLAYYRDYYHQKKYFPGAFKHRMWQGKNGNIPTLDSIVVVPVNLQTQMESEIRRYLYPGTFDIIPYIGAYKSRKTFWEDVVKKSVQPAGRRLFMATSSALSSDGEQLYKLETRKPSGPLIKDPKFRRVSCATVYRQNWLLAGIDEAHVCRNLNKTHIACRALREASSCTVAMTATPVISRILDLWNLGRMLGLVAFVGQRPDDEARKIERNLRSAAREDKKTSKQVGDKTLVLHANLTGHHMPNKVQEVMLESIGAIRDAFKGKVIRRTVNSEDYHGSRIIRLKAYEEHMLLLDLYDSEIRNLDIIANELAQDSETGVQYGMGKAFYIKFRRAITHPSCNAEYEWTNPESLDEWRMDPSRKLDTLAEIIKYHLESDGRLAVSINADSSLVFPSSTHGENPIPMSPDKLLVYAAWPSSNEQILTVLQLYGNAVEQFNDPAGPRIMIISGVGMSGLNLPVANILIMIDTLWSAQEDRQLIGRIWRQPQPKTVLVYRLIAKNTPDVFLNNISFDKLAMHEAFARATPSMQQLFRSNIPSSMEDTETLSVDDGDEDVDSIVADINHVEDPAPQTRKRKTQAKVEINMGTKKSRIQTAFDLQ
ncbi:P-loop containing nucleoside triphosphate hydrolase protein [Mycena leptocephala]|nr:P-loop containing nucleoside triphosphate hydrolase protein [Mycena leptocephala]